MRIEQFPDVLVARLFSFNPAVFFKVVDADKADVDLKISFGGQRDTSPLAIRCISNRSIAAVTAMARWLPHDPEGAVILLFAAVLGAVQFFRLQRRRRLMEDTPTARIRSAAQGYVSSVPGAAARCAIALAAHGHTLRLVAVSHRAAQK